MEIKRGLRTTYKIRDGVYSYYALPVRSKYSKTIVIIAPLMKFGGEVVLNIVENTSPRTRVVLITPTKAQMESLRSQLPYKLRSRVMLRECELHSGASIRMVILWLTVTLDRIDLVVHLEPQLDIATTMAVSRRMKALLCGNSCSRELFEEELPLYFGNQLHFVPIEFALSEEPSTIAKKVMQMIEI